MMKLVLALSLGLFVFVQISANPNQKDYLWRNIPQRQARDGEVRDCTGPNNEYLPPTAVVTTDRLADLRAEMTNKQYDAYIIPSEDEHLNEYIAPRDYRRAWISGFSGSAGVAVVTQTEAALWTDGRYFLQAEMQLDCNWILMKTGEPGVLSIEEWLIEKLIAGQTVAGNPFVFSISSWKSYELAFVTAGISMNTSVPDLIDVIWTDRPATLGDKIEIHPLEFAGEDWVSKVTTARNTMQSEGADILLLTSLEEIAWLLNLRGNDIPNIPVFNAYLLINSNASQNVTLYANTTQASTDEVQQHLNPIGCDSTCVNVTAYEDAAVDLRYLATGDVKVWMSSEGTTYGMYDTVPESKQISIESPVKVPKAVKNPTQVEAMKKAHIYDAVALCEYLMWLEKNVPLGGVDELNGRTYLQQLRLAQERSKGLSFGGISASGPNAAIIHYGVSEETNRNLTTDEMYLIDSGGQYLEGSTDVTRTVHFGTPTDFEKEAFTRVLMGVIDVELAVYPQTEDGNYVDILARQHLLEVGLNFQHSTGHGIGQYLSIHEYPPGIGRPQAAGYPLQIGMFTSNEPGYYENGQFGIRIENIVVVQEAHTEHHFGEYDYYSFEPVTLVPIQTKLIDVDLMSMKQIFYLNNYHAKVLSIVGEEALKQNKNELHEWLKTNTDAIGINNSKTLTSFNIFTLFTAIAVYLLH